MSEAPDGGAVPNAREADVITTETELDLKQFVEGGDGISVIRGGGAVRAWNGIRYRAGLRAVTTTR